MNNFKSDAERKRHWDEWAAVMRGWDAQDIMRYPEKMPNGTLLESGAFWTLMFNVLTAVALESELIRGEIEAVYW